VLGYSRLVLRPCLTCGRLTPNSYCPAHAPVRKTPGRSSRPQDRFREAVLARAGNQCQWIEDGVRCPETRDLEAHHLEAFRDQPTMDPTAGVCLCRAHHHEVERRAADELARAAIEHWGTERGKAQIARMRQRAAR
jgi:hypothetical protein